MSNNAAERAMRPIATGRRNWTFAGSDEGGRRAAAIYTLIETAKLNDVDPLAWLADMLARLHDHPANRDEDEASWIDAALVGHPLLAARRYVRAIPLACDQRFFVTQR